MKILFTGCCATLVVPFRSANTPRSCSCGKMSVWWVNPLSGILKVHTKDHNELANILCLHNGIFSETGMKSPQYYVERAMAASNTVFAETHSMVVLVPVGTTSDVSYASDEELAALPQPIL